MAVRPILKMGHPTLRKVAAPLTREQILSPWFEALLVDMKDTMKHAGGIGLAAPQIGESVQLAIIEFAADSQRYPNMGDMPFTIIINPAVEVLDSTTQSYWEGCLSLPGLRGLVPRPRKIRLTFESVDGKTASVEAQDFPATVIQHELDHLFGLLYIDHIKDLTKFSYIDEYTQFYQNPSDPTEGARE